MTRQERVKILLTERAVFGRPLVFCDVPRGRDADPAYTAGWSRVHVVGPDEDQPAFANFSDWALNRKIRMVCGLDIRRTPLQGTRIGTFDDNRLCAICHGLFGEDGWMIFDDNDDDAQENADAVIAHIRADKGHGWYTP